VATSRIRTRHESGRGHLVAAQAVHRQLRRADLDGLVRIIKRKLKKIQYRPHLVDGWLAATGLIIEPW